MKNVKLNAVSLATGVALSVAALAGASAAEQPFAAKALAHGYMLADAGDKAKEPQASSDKAMSGGKSAEKEGDKAGGKKVQDGKCGEGKCGAKKK